MTLLRYFIIATVYIMFTLAVSGAVYIVSFYHSLHLHRWQYQYIKLKVHWYLQLRRPAKYTQPILASTTVVTFVFTIALSPCEG